MTFEESRFFKEQKLMLSESDYAEAEKAFDSVEEEFLQTNKIPRNCVGLGIGTKWKHGEPTGEPALLVFVTHKVSKDMLPSSDLVPAKLGGMQTDVIEVGYLQAAPKTPLPSARTTNTTGLTPYQIEQLRRESSTTDYERERAALEAAYGTMLPETELEIRRLANRSRPIKGGYSISHPRTSAGTVGTCVYDMMPGGAVNPPKHGVGRPNKFYILSNNHILADCNDANIGDPILQPGRFDGGSEAYDTVGRLTRFVPINFEPFMPREQHNNYVDAAIAEGHFRDLDREIYWIGNVRGWRRRSMVKVGTPVQKTGRTTDFTTGRILALKATVDVNFGGGRLARFKDQIITTNMSAGGDSGALLVTPDNVAVGLLFAGSSVATIHNQIEHVRSLLRIEVAEQIL